MKRRTAFYKSLAASIAFCLFSCASAPEKKIDSIYVMAYDYDNNEVMNAAISLDGEEIGKAESVISVMRKLNLTCEEAMELLDIDIDSRPIIAATVKKLLEEQKAG